ncbi:MAG: CDP-alcohol phosphatidyltransferase family protein [Alphaproteobacteria bacterium]|nr:CDP-alcohol phosphatidyltransferase family protein [Alphaproteobacteria bacterium]
MTVHLLKPTFQALLRPLARWIARRGGTANQVTALAFVGSAALGAALATLGAWWTPLWLALPAWCFVRMALNAVDGLLAREHGQSSRLGTYVNELEDVASDAALILPLATVGGFRPALIVGIALLSSWTELAGALGPSVGASRRHEGPMGKPDRALVLGLLGAWIGWTGSAPPLAMVVQLAWLALLAATVLRRMGHAIDEAGGAS